MNCLVKQNLCKENKVKKQYLGSCKGKRATFGDLSKYGVVKNLSVDGCTTNIKPPAVIDYGSDTDFVNENMAIYQGMQESQTEEFSYSEYVVEMSLIRPVITEENMPNYLLL